MKLARFAVALFLLGACSSSSSSSEPKRLCEGKSAPLSCACDVGGDSPPAQPVEVCDETLLGGPALCCQGASGCSCVRIGCQGTTGSCACGAASSASQPSECGGGTCCNWVGVEAGNCSCGSTACGSESVQVASCNAAVLECGPNRTKVTRCLPQ